MNPLETYSWGLGEKLSQNGQSGQKKSEKKAPVLVAQSKSRRGAKAERRREAAFRDAI
jgi:hypothetical protein